MDQVVTAGRWILFVLFMILFVWASLFNWSVCIRMYILHQDHVPSVAPLAGGIAGVTALLLCPLAEASRLAWVPLLVDYGTVPWFAMLPFVVLWRRHVKGE